MVYRGHHLQLPREVAIKSIIARDNRDLRQLKPRFEKEAFIQSQLDHSGIVKIYDYIVAEQTYYIIMEYVQGRSLAQLLAREACPLSLSRALDLFEQILTAVAYAQNFVYRDQNNLTHRGIIHRDLKPANIIVTPDDRAKITDFGIVKLVGSENTDTFGASYGSPLYVSPEQAEGRVVDERSDIYSLGIILYEMLTCAPPFGSDSESLSRTDVLRAHVERTPRLPSEINAEVTPEIEAVIMRALEKNPDQRFRSASKFLRAVRQARGRETNDIADEKISQHSSSSVDVDVNTNELDGYTTGRAGRESYITQPIKAATCLACGTTAEPNDANCRACGQQLTASPATVKLTLREAISAQKKRVRGLWIFVALFCIALLSAALFYTSHRENNRRDAATAAQNTEAARPTPAPASALVEIHPVRVSVDSSYNGYSAAPLTDNETDVRKISKMRYNKGNWSSDETPAPHWIQLDFDKPTRIAAVYIYWGFDHNRFLPSRRVSLAIPDEHASESIDRIISEIEPGQDYDRTAFEFAPVTTKQLTIVQPEKQGPVNRPFVMWVREVKVFGMADDASPSITP